MLANRMDTRRAGGSAPGLWNAGSDAGNGAGNGAGRGRESTYLWLIKVFLDLLRY